MRETTKLNIRKVAAALFALILLVTLAAPAVSAAGAGDGIVWTFSGGTLTISGGGAMNNFTETNPAPWSELGDQIRVIVVENGVTSVGNLAFYGLGSVTAVTLLSTVKTIGSYAFANCVSLKMLTLGAGVETIGDSAFECCESLQSVRLPNTLKSLGKKVFYRCYSLQTITIPASVTEMGSQIFTYCSSLVSADVQASVSALPEWMFYGCDSLSQASLAANITSAGRKAFYRCENLTSLYYSGDSSGGQTLLSSIRETSLSDFSESFINYSVSSGSAENKNTEVSDNTITTTTTTVNSTQNSMVSTTVTQSTKIENSVIGKTETSVSIDAVLENIDGWRELVEAIEKGELENVDEGNINVSVNVNDTQEVPGETLGSLSGKDVNITIDMNDGSTVKIDCERLEDKALSESYGLTYQLTANSEPTKSQIKTIGEAESYLLSFSGNADFDFSPKIFIGKDKAYSTSTLYQNVPGKGLELLQSVVVDKDGYATYYLQSTKSSTQYVIALNVSTVKSADAIIPEEMVADYGDVVQYDQIQYISTGVRMFMGLSLFQFTFVILGVTAFLFIAVGIVMGVLYRKKKLEQYYQTIKKA